MSLHDRGRRSTLAATLYRGTGVFLAIYVAGSAISFGVHLFVARVLGATSYGYFVYGTSWMAILLLCCNIGLKPTAVRFVFSTPRVDRCAGESRLVRLSGT